MIRILLADDQENVRRGLRMRFAIEPDLEVVGEASTGAEAVRLARELSPDVIVMDVEMPVMDGFAAAKELSGDCCRIVILSLHDDARARERAKSLGCNAFVAKHQADSALLDAVREAAGASPRAGA
jgi:DNA-binding NarL/FixJ family response regulator